MTGIKAAMAMAKQRQIVKEKERIINNFAASPTMKCRAVTKVTKLILLNSPYLLSGKYFEVKAKSIGAGVYELWLELKE